MNKSQEHISKFLSKILRHDPSIIGITLDSQGWADVTELMIGMQKQGKFVELSDLEIVVVKDSKAKNGNPGRYSFNEDKTKIRANQGHNKKLKHVKLDYTPLLSREVPNWLYHGTNSRFVEAIKKEGLVKMNRQHVHLSDEIETANEVGDRRLKQDTETHIFKISTIEAMNAGVVFYKSKNGVYLADAIPAWLLR